MIPIKAVNIMILFEENAHLFCSPLTLPLSTYIKLIFYQYNDQHSPLTQLFVLLLK